MIRSERVWPRIIAHADRSLENLRSTSTPARRRARLTCALVCQREFSLIRERADTGMGVTQAVNTDVLKACALRYSAPWPVKVLHSLFNPQIATAQETVCFEAGPTRPGQASYRPASFEVNCNVIDATLPTSLKSAATSRPDLVEVNCNVGNWCCQAQKNSPAGPSPRSPGVGPRHSIPASSASQRTRDYGPLLGMGGCAGIVED